jgi:hypothetical protein
MALKPGSPPPPGEAAPAARGPSAPGPVTKITVVYGTETQDRMNAVIAGFRTAHPEIDLDLLGTGSLESAQAILEGKLRPTVWLPARRSRGPDQDPSG